MINLHEIQAEIDRLENGETSYKNCEKLSVLYSVRDNLQPDYSYAPAPVSEPVVSPYDSEFARLVKSKNLDDVLKILEEHFDCIKVLYPREYEKIKKRISEL